MTREFNQYYHASSVPTNGRITVNNLTSLNIREKYNLRVGQVFWKSPKKLMITCTGDSYPAAHTPANIESITACIVKIHVYNNVNLHQTLLIGLPFIISGLKHQETCIINLYHNLVFQLGKQGGLSFYSTNAKCNICVDYFVYHNGDWPFFSGLILRSFGHMAQYPFIYWLHYYNGQFFAVSNILIDGNDEWFDAIKAGIKEEHMPWNLNVSNISNEDNFFCLCNEEHWIIWQNQIESFVENIRNVNQLSYKQINTRRKTFARSKSQCVLYKTPNILVQWIIDVMHFMLRHGINIITGLTILCFCTCNFSINEVIAVLSHCC